MNFKPVRVVSTALLALLVLSLVLPLAIPSSAQVKEITIGALYPLSGDLASFGKANVEALKIALEDVNKWFEQNGYPWRFKLEIRDSETKPETAKSLFRTLHTAGIRYFLGPMSSGELKEIIAEVKAGAKAVVISPSSTSPALALEDTIYRFPPPDDFQGKVLNMLFQKDGVTHVIIVYRNDDWGKGLADFVELYSKDFKITIVDKIPYDPKAPTFGPIVETVRAKIRGLGVDLSKVAIDLIAFEEGVGFLTEASKIEELGKVKWYGSDGTALSAELLKDPVASTFAAKAVWKNTITFAATDIAVRVYWTVKDRVGYSPDPYSFISYDCLWVLALAIAYAGGPEDVDKVAEAVLKVLETYEGASGKITLNRYGDRAGSDYAIFAPVTIAGKVEWRMVELYDFGKNTIVKVEKDPFAEKPATLPTTLPKFSPPPKPTTPTPTPTPAPGVSPALIAVIVIVIVAVAAIAYYILRR
ncbi:MAG: ABC transporter substrate-binding protein [Acidilobaceae archaeon]|jgi:branched-chain amino acid transport system substrate-binding protein